MRFFITGTAGFIGFHLARRLLDHGHVVAGFDGLTDYYDPTLKTARHAVLEAYGGFTAHIGMLEERATLRAAIAQAAPDVIVHLAAQAGVRYSIENPKAFIDANMVGSFHVIDAAREFAVSHLLLSSTSSVYGASPAIPFRETDSADAPLSTYAATKRGMEMTAHSYAHLHGIPTTVFRFFTVYGPWGRPDMALFKFVHAMLRDEPIDVYGAGQMSRDFTYVGDLVEAIARLVDRPPAEDNRIADCATTDSLSAEAPFRVVNIAGGEPVGLMDFVETVEACLGKTARKTMLPMQDGDVPRTFAAPDLLVALTGYRPATPLAEGVRAFVDWYLDHYAIGASR